MTFWKTVWAVVVGVFISNIIVLGIYGTAIGIVYMAVHGTH